VRPSRRYPGYWRVYNLEYRKALLRILREDAADLVEMLGLQGTLQDLHSRLEDAERHSAAGRITRGILGGIDSQAALHIKGREFNQEAEAYYRNTLRISQTQEALDFLEEDLRKPGSILFSRESAVREELSRAGRCEDPLKFLLSVKEEVLEGTIAPDDLRLLIHLVLTCIHQDIQQAKAALNEGWGDERPETPIHRAANR
jgi:hypothetical protein